MTDPLQVPRSRYRPTSPSSLSFVNLSKIGGAYKMYLRGGIEYRVSDLVHGYLHRLGER